MATRYVQPEPSIVDLEIGGIHPFYSAGDTADACLGEAHALLTMLTSAFFLSGDVGPTATNEFENLHDRVKGEALAGVARIIATAQYLRDVENQKRSYRA